MARNLMVSLAVAVARALSTTTTPLAAYKEQMRRCLSTEDFASFWDKLKAASERPLRSSLAVTRRGRALDFSQKDRVPWWHGGFFVESDLGRDVGHVTGRYYLQEAAAMLPVAALLEDFDGNGIAIDACAAPGGKTVQLASANVTVIANELSSSRLASLAHNVQRCGLLNVVLSHSDAEDLLNAARDKCDLVLLDAPCSGETQTRREGLKLETQLMKKTGQKKTVETQLRLLKAAVRAAKPRGGRIVYATCSLDPRENEDVVKAILAEYPDVHIDSP